MKDSTSNVHEMSSNGKSVREIRSVIACDWGWRKKLSVNGYKGTLGGKGSVLKLAVVMTA